MFEQKPISKITAILMVLLAFGADATQFIIGLIPIAGDLLGGIIAIPAFGIFYFWFKFHGIDLSSPKRLMVMISSLVLETIGIVLPAIDLPGLTAAVVFTIILSKIPKTSGPVNVIGSAAGGKIKFRGEGRMNMPLYENGRRQPSGPKKQPKYSKQGDRPKLRPSAPTSPSGQSLDKQPEQPKRDKRDAVKTPDITPKRNWNSEGIRPISEPQNSSENRNGQEESRTEEEYRSPDSYEKSAQDAFAAEPQKEKELDEKPKHGGIYDEDTSA